VQSVQSGHALAKFCIENSEIANSWHKNSQYLVYLSVEDENSLRRLMIKLESRGIMFSVFEEPDLDNQITAIAIEPTKEARKVCSNLPLALRKKSEKELKNDIMGAFGDYQYTRLIRNDNGPDEEYSVIEKEDYEKCVDEIIEIINE